MSYHLPDPLCRIPRWLSLPTCGIFGYSRAQGYCFTGITKLHAHQNAGKGYPRTSEYVGIAILTT